MFKNLTLRTRILISFLTIAGFIVAAGFVLLQVSDKNDSLSSQVAHDETERIVNLYKIDQQLGDIEGDLLFFATRSYTKQEGQDLKQHLEGAVKDLKASKTRYIEIVEVVHEDQSDFKKYFTTYISLAEEIINAKTTATTESLADQQKSLIAAHKGIDQALKTVLDHETKKLEAAQTEIASKNQFVQIAGYITLAVATVLAIFFGLRLSGSLTRPLRRLQTSVEHIANGDFSQKIEAPHTRDEISHLTSSFSQMSDRLRDSYRRLELEKTRDETLMESLGEGLLAIDEKGQIVLVNQNAINLLELPSRESLDGQGITAVFTVSSELDENNKALSEEDRPEVLTLKTDQPNGGVFGFERKAEGRRILVSINAYPVLHEGKSNGAIVVVRDVTKEKEIDRMKTEFISLASHQLRTPLSAIKWFSEMLVNGDAGQLNDEQLDFSKNIFASTERMIDLVNSLLNISRIESGRIIVDPKPTDLHELVSGIINDLKAKTEEKQQTLVVSVHKELGKINLDPQLIGQVYLNFLTNAIKYTPKGGEVSVFISRKDDQVLSQITDSGYGIPKAQQDRVFQKFFRAENVAKVETDGTGLGLYLVKAIIESSGGKVWFESEEDKGTTFWFTLPLSGMKAKEGEVSLDV